jgi:hypothetical protein
LISWEYSFEKIGKDLELAKKKKQALDDLFNTGKISQPTYDSFEKNLTNTIADIQAQQKVLAEKMASKVAELEQQINTLEMFLANAEILHAAGEIDEELHTRESNAFTQGLEATKQELDVIKEIVTNLMPEKLETTLPPAPGEITEAQPTEEVLEETQEIPTELPIEAPIETQAEVETESISEETEIEQTVEMQAEETASEEALVEETPTEETPIEDSPIEEATSEEENVEEATTEETLTEEDPEGFESFEENAPEISVEETPTEEQISSSEDTVEETIDSPELTTEATVDESPVEEETQVETEEEAEEISSFQEEEAASEE